MGCGSQPEVVTTEKLLGDQSAYQAQIAQSENYYKQNSACYNTQNGTQYQQM